MAELKPVPIWPSAPGEPPGPTAPLPGTPARAPSPAPAPAKKTEAPFDPWRSSQPQKPARELPFPTPAASTGRDLSAFGLGDGAAKQRAAQEKAKAAELKHAAELDKEKKAAELKHAAELADKTQADERAAEDAAREKRQAAEKHHGHSHHEDAHRKKR